MDQKRIKQKKGSLRGRRAKKNTKRKPGIHPNDNITQATVNLLDKLLDNLTSYKEAVDSPIKKNGFKQ